MHDKESVIGIIRLHYGLRHASTSTFKAELGVRRSLVRIVMAEFDRLRGGSEWIDLEFVERERTPEQIVEVGSQVHLAGLSLLNTKQYL